MFHTENELLRQQPPCRTHEHLEQNKCPQRPSKDTVVHRISPHPPGITMLQDVTTSSQAHGPSQREDPTKELIMVGEGKIRLATLKAMVINREMFVL